MRKRIVGLALVLVLAFSLLAHAAPARPVTAEGLYQSVYRQVLEQLQSQLGGFLSQKTIESLAQRLTAQLVLNLTDKTVPQIPRPDSKPQPPAPKPVPSPQPIPTPVPEPQPAPAPKPEPTVPPESPAGLTKDEAQMLELVNQERAKAGLKPFVVDKGLVETARAKSRDMVENNYFGHISETLGSPFDQMSAAGISYRYAGENIAGAPTVAQAHNGLMNSPGHRANILSANFTRIGIGIVDGGPYGKMFTQQFAG
ncbi:MAG: CAP domain-containing protein [bacterium]|jgi:uncharacterized YkwD family protein